MTERAEDQLDWEKSESLPSLFSKNDAIESLPSLFFKDWWDRFTYCCSFVKSNERELIPLVFKKEWRMTGAIHSFGIKRRKNFQKHDSRKSWLNHWHCSFFKEIESASFMVALFKRSMRAIPSHSHFFKDQQEWKSEDQKIERVNSQTCIPRPPYPNLT